MQYAYTKTCVSCCNNSSLVLISPRDHAENVIQKIHETQIKIKCLTLLTYCKYLKQGLNIKP
jgi:hypothetical protein